MKSVKNMDKRSLTNIVIDVGVAFHMLLGVKESCENIIVNWAAPIAEDSIPYIGMTGARAVEYGIPIGYVIGGMGITYVAVKAVDKYWREV